MLEVIETLAIVGLVCVGLAIIMLIGIIWDWFRDEYIRYWKIYSAISKSVWYRKEFKDFLVARKKRTICPICKQTVSWFDLLEDHNE